MRRVKVCRAEEMLQSQDGRRSNLSSETDFSLNDVDYQLALFSSEDLQGLSRGPDLPWFLLLMSLSLVLSPQLSSEDVPDLTHSPVFLAVSLWLWCWFSLLKSHSNVSQARFKVLMFLGSLVFKILALVLLIRSPERTSWTSLAASSSSRFLSPHVFISLSPQLSSEDVPDLTRGPVFLSASLLMALVLVFLLSSLQKTSQTSLAARSSSRFLSPHGSGCSFFSALLRRRPGPHSRPGLPLRLPPHGSGFVLSPQLSSEDVPDLTRGPVFLSFPLSSCLYLSLFFSDLLRRRPGPHTWPGLPLHLPPHGSDGSFSSALLRRRPGPHSRPGLPLVSSLLMSLSLSLLLRSPQKTSRTSLAARSSSRFLSPHVFISLSSSQISSEDVPDLTRGPVFLSASLLMALVLVLSPQLSSEDVPDLTRGPVFLSASLLMALVLVLSPQLSSEDVPDLTHSLVFLGSSRLMSLALVLSPQLSSEDVPDLTRGPVFLSASLLMALVLVLIMLVCGVGNLLFVVTLVRSGRLRSLADRLVVNLALSDALVALCCPLLLDYYTVRALSWTHGWFLCAGVSYVRAVSLHVSTNALLGIAVDRYLAIVHPLRPRWHRSRLVVLLVWLVPALVSVPVILTSSQTPFSGADGVLKIFCGQVWSVDRRLLYQSYFLSVMLVQFLFPSVPGFQTPQIRSRLLRRRRTVLVLVLVLAAYITCWSPYYVFSVLRDFHASFVSTQRHALTVFYAVDCLAMSNGVFNTLCFVWVKKRDQNQARTRSMSDGVFNTLCLVWVKKRDQNQTRTRTGVRLSTFVKTRSSLEENRTTSTRGTET
ncbi:hypothetical protein WMY93_006790 [Mugilogobius chulae]|uniref:G-protein coupled receptors family 1 profile domain-containing protein n=1 Tax=Mugilogobius chulae TaxID=88201 RepID=A0AAW0PL44_9GOBI